MIYFVFCQYFVNICQYLNLPQVYEISFQETLQQLAVRVGKISGKTLPGQIEADLAERLLKKRDGQANAKRKKSTMGLPILVRELDMMLNEGRRGGEGGEGGVVKKTSDTVSAQYVHHSDEESEEERERGIV